MIKGHPELVRHYRQDFMTHKSHSQQPNAKASPHEGRTAA